MLGDFRLKVFEAVAACGGFTAAARELGVTQGAVSQNVAELEKELGVMLFDRGRGEVTLSADGRRFREYSSQILHWYEAANAAFSADAPKPCEVALDSGRVVQIWTFGDDLHLKLKDD